MKLFSCTKFWKRKLWKDHKLGSSFWKKEYLKVKLHIINKETIVPGSCWKKDELFLKTIRCSGKLWSICSQRNILSERWWWWSTVIVALHRHALMFWHRLHPLPPCTKCHCKLPDIRTRLFPRLLDFFTCPALSFTSPNYTL